MTGLERRSRVVRLAAAAGLVVAVVATGGCSGSESSPKPGSFSSPKAAERFQPVEAPKGGGGRR